MIPKLAIFFFLILYCEGLPNKICPICKCISDTDADCSSKHVLHHFNNSIWEGVTFEKLLYDNNNIIHLTKMPSFEVFYLSLRSNKIAKIDDEAFRLVKNLTILDLSDNYLTSDNFNSEIFIGNYSVESYIPLESLEELRLSDNALHTFNENIFSHLPNLKILLLDSNPLKIIDFGTLAAIGNSPNLQILDLSSTMLRDIPTSMFHPLRHMRVLNISNNQFRNIPSAINELQSLEEIVLDNNDIEEVESFPSLPKLKILKINYMPSLRAIKAHSMDQLPSLEELKCSGNKKLTSLSSAALWKYETAPAEGQIWPPLKKLYLNGNGLSTLGFELVSRWEELEVFDFQRNPVMCDCSNQWLITTLMPLLVSNNLSHTANLICADPPEMKGKSLKTLSDNKYHMRCLDTYGHQPERDSSVLIGVFIGILISVPVTVIVILLYRRRIHTEIRYSRAFYHKSNSRESFA